MNPQPPTGLNVDLPEMPPAVVHAQPRAAECRICLGPHDDEIHAATISVRQWFRDEVTKSFVVPGLI